MQEEWRGCVGHEGRYLVNRKGVVRSLLRRPEGGESTIKTEYLYGGKRVVWLMINRKNTRRRVDLLVQQAFPEIRVDMKEASTTSASPCSSTDEVATRILLALKGLGTVLDFTDTKQVLYAYSLVKELLTTNNLRRLT